MTRNANALICVARCETLVRIGGDRVESNGYACRAVFCADSTVPSV
jgi:hypothetical protein